MQGPVSYVDYNLGETMQPEGGLEEVRRDIEALVEKLDRLIAEGKDKEN